MSEEESVKQKLVEGGFVHVGKTSYYVGKLKLTDAIILKLMGHKIVRLELEKGLEKIPDLHELTD